MRISRFLILLLWLALHCLQALKGQSYSMDVLFDDMPQMSHLNPAWQPQEEDRLVLFLPSPYVQLGHNGPTIDELLIEEDGNKLTLDTYSSFDPDERFDVDAGARIQVLLLGLKLGDWFVQLDNHVDYHSELDYSAGLMRVIWEGNGSFVGQELNLGSRWESWAMMKTGLTLSRQLGRFRVGVRGQYINGLYHAETEKSRLILETRESDFGLRFDTDYRLRTSGVLDYRSLDDVDFDLEAGDVFDNTGWALELGGEWQFSEDLVFGGSLGNLGRVRWNERVELISSKVDTTYTGIEFDDIVEIEGDDIEFNVDTVEAILAIQNDEGASYTQHLSPRLSLYGRWQLSESWQVGALVGVRDRLDETSMDFTLWGQYHLGQILTVGASWSGTQNHYDRIGIHIRGRFGPVAVFGATQDVISAFRPFDSQTVSATMGIGLIF